MKLQIGILLLFAVCLVHSQLLTKLEEQNLQFDLKDLDQDILQQQIIKLVALKKGDSFSIQSNIKNQFSIQKNQEVCASIEYQKKLNETGWDIVFLDTNQSCTPDEQMQCAGFLEGMASKQQITDFLYNISSQRQSSNDQYKAFFNNVYNNLLAKADNPPQGQEKYWKTARLFLLQLIGIKNGFNSLEKNKKSQLKLWQISLPNIDGQADEIDTIIQSGSEDLGVGKSIFVKQQTKLRKSINHKRKKPLSEWENAMMKSRCSVFFKLLTSEENGSKILNDVFASHSTWESYSSMNRVYKFYRLPNLKNQHTWTQMSSYPGAITSTDDFIIKEGKFLTTETSISSMKEDQVSQFKARDVDITDFLRVQTATSLAQTGIDWAKLMSKNGEVKMYSSEWMILDFQNLQKGQSIPKQTFVVLSSSYDRQIIEDKTKELIDQTYFASFNNPHSEDIREYLGYNEAAKENELFELKNDPRYKIFKHFQGQTTSMQKVKWLMLHNSYGKKPKDGEPSFESPFAALGARGDLSNSKANYGEVDVKVVNLDYLHKFQVEAISGPSHQEQPVFVWSGNNRHQGQPTTWNFDWIKISLEDQE